jgi:hypothetical protein
VDDDLVQLEVDDQIDIPREVESPLFEQPEPRLQFHLGEAMDEGGLRSLRARRDTQLVLLLGPEASGKSTLLTALYERVARGESPVCWFAGCETLLGFESRCHLGRAASGRQEPDTARTPHRSLDRYLHLRIATQDQRARDLVLVDLAGEHFDHLAKTADFGEYQACLEMAHHVVVVADGAALVSVAERHAALRSLQNVARILAECALLGEEHHVDLVVSKVDLVRCASNEHRSWVERKAAELYEILPGSGSLIETAARPADSGQPVGLDPVLLSWLQPRRQRARASAVADSAKRRSFESFAG